MKNKRVYIVWGNQDGNIGVYTNKKLAYEASVNYMKYENITPISYSKFCKNIKDNHWSNIHNNKDVEANVEVIGHWLNA